MGPTHEDFKRLDALRWATEAEAAAAAEALRAVNFGGYWWLPSEMSGNNVDPNFRWTVAGLHRGDPLYGLTIEEIDQLPPEDDGSHLRLVRDD